MRKHIHLPLAAAAVLIVSTASAGLAADSAMGKKLLTAKCMGCHGTEVYTRADRKVGSLQALEKQVAVCSGAAGTGWTEAEKADVVQYLNRNFYKFK